MYTFELYTLQLYTLEPRSIGLLSEENLQVLDLLPELAHCVCDTAEEAASRLVELYQSETARVYRPADLVKLTPSNRSAYQTRLRVEQQLWGAHGLRLEAVEEGNVISAFWPISDLCPASDAVLQSTLQIVPLSMSVVLGASGAYQYLEFRLDKKVDNRAAGFKLGQVAAYIIVPDAQAVRLVGCQHAELGALLGKSVMLIPAEDVHRLGSKDGEQYTFRMRVDGSTVRRSSVSDPLQRWLLDLTASTEVVQQRFRKVLLDSMVFIDAAKQRTAQQGPGADLSDFYKQPPLQDMSVELRLDWDFEDAPEPCCAYLANGTGHKQRHACIGLRRALQSFGKAWEQAHPEVQKDWLRLKRFIPNLTDSYSPRDLGIQYKNDRAQADNILNFPFHLNLEYENYEQNTFTAVKLRLLFLQAGLVEPGPGVVFFRLIRPRNSYYSEAQLAPDGCLLDKEGKLFSGYTALALSSGCSNSHFQHYGGPDKLMHFQRPRAQSGGLQLRSPEAGKTLEALKTALDRASAKDPTLKTFKPPAEGTRTGAAIAFARSLAEQEEDVIHTAEEEPESDAQDSPSADSSAPPAAAAPVPPPPPPPPAAAAAAEMHGVQAGTARDSRVASGSSSDGGAESESLVLPPPPQMHKRRRLILDSSSDDDE
ncbi:hypothetical protein WJX73_006380 [Symbiochloris irregularis]|uniref:Uncharacterized protein n=1 Tax=Symbiochloris irregularis TaxID=706552 RepID=A0AAW1P170_9CHLO